MRYIAKEELQSLPGYPAIEEALFYGTGWMSEFEPISDLDSLHRRRWPFTRRGYVAVQAIYNMYRWASTYSSSLGDYDRTLAGAIHGLGLGQLMELNTGRRMNEPALFPEGDLLEGKG